MLRHFSYCVLLATSQLRHNILTIYTTCTLFQVSKFYKFCGNPLNTLLLQNVTLLIGIMFGYLPPVSSSSYTVSWFSVISSYDFCNYFFCKYYILMSFFRCIAIIWMRVITLANFNSQSCTTWSHVGCSGLGCAPLPHVSLLFAHNIMNKCCENYFTSIHLFK